MSKKSRSVSPSTSKIETEQVKSENFIVINDSIVYTNPEQFQQSIALQLYNETTLMNSELQRLQQSLSAARANYDTATTITEKQKIAEQIRILEPAIFQLSKEISIKKKQAINKEINFLFNK